jgi:hypothetical protein
MMKIDSAPDAPRAPRPDSGAPFFPFSPSFERRSAELDKIALDHRTSEPGSKSLNSGCQVLSVDSVAGTPKCDVRLRTQGGRRKSQWKIAARSKADL